VINVFNRKNVAFRNYRLVTEDDGGISLLESDSAQFPLLPFIGVNIKW